MWLLHTKSLQLREFSGELLSSAKAPLQRTQRIPRYAILSHCWHEEEVLFKDIQDLHRARKMNGFRKVERCCEQAAKIDYNWAWVDTCCIDKSSSAELSEAINSMFKWYEHAGTCLVYLDDVDDDDPYRPGASFRKSRWFTRGWTPQELIAPEHIIFFSKSWSFIGTKDSLMTLLSDITRIPVDALTYKSPFSSFSIAQRMSWAADRQTTRTEDQAYSLMGLFNIFMPIIYGEGSSAFRRLQLELIQRLGDQSIFAWSSKSHRTYHFPLASQWSQIDNDISDSSSTFDPPEPIYSSILASSPADFRNSGDIVPFPASERKNLTEELPEVMSEYSWTHLGLRIRMPLVLVRILGGLLIGLLSCWNPKKQTICGVVLRCDAAHGAYHCFGFQLAGDWARYSHLAAIPKGAYGEVVRRLAIFRDIYINEPERGQWIHSCGHGWFSSARFLLFLPNISIRKLEEMGFSLAGYAFRLVPDCAQNVKVQRDSIGDLSFRFVE